MHTTSLRSVGGSVMLTIPPEFLDQLQLKAGGSVVISVVDGRLIIEPKRAPRYTLEQLLAMTDPTVFAANKSDIWITGGPVGRELI